MSHVSFKGGSWIHRGSNIYQFTLRSSPYLLSGSMFTFPHQTHAAVRRARGPTGHLRGPGAAEREELLLLQSKSSRTERTKSTWHSEWDLAA